MWELDCEESWVPKNWCFWGVVLEKTLESLLDCWEIQLVYSEGDQPWDFFGRNDAKAETSVLWPPHAKSWLIGKDPDAGRDWGQEEKGTTEDEMAGWHHWLNGRESQWTPGVGDGQGSLACCDSWGCKESDTTEQLIWSDLVTSLCRVFSCVIGRGCLLWPVHSLGKTVSLCSASFCTPRPNLPVTPSISWLPTFAFQCPMMNRTFSFFFFFDVSSRRSFRSS